MLGDHMQQTDQRGRPLKGGFGQASLSNGEVSFQNALRLFMVILTGVVVLAVPNFANLMALVGATCCTMIAFVLPGIFHLKLFRG